MRLFRIAGKIDSRLSPVPISTHVYENDTWIPLIYEIREKGMVFLYKFFIIRANYG